MQTGQSDRYLGGVRAGDGDEGVNSEVDRASGRRLTLPRITNT